MKKKTRKTIINNLLSLSSTIFILLTTITTTTTTTTSLSSPPPTTQSTFSISLPSSTTNTTTTTPIYHYHHHHQQQQLERTTTLIDLLSNSTDHSKLLHLIQISRLVPTINLLTNVTLFAPTNQAIDSSPILTQSLRPLELSSRTLEQDNLHFKLRQTILYHLLNFTLPSSISSDSPQSIDSLLFPQPPPTTTSPQSNVEAQDHRTISSGLLGHHPQKLRIIHRDQTTFIAVDAFGRGGIPLPPTSEFRNATNALLVPINSVLSLPPSLKTLISSHPLLTTYASILPERFLDQLELIPHLTVFAPHDQAWKNLSSIELAYLKSNFSSDDSIKVFRQASADNVLDPDGGIGYSSLLRQESKLHPPDQTFLLPTLDGKLLSIGLGSDPIRFTINGSQTLEHDILANNGVLHIIPNLLLSDRDNPLELDAEKYLLALNCTKFVSLFRLANLTSTYLNNRSKDGKSYTILAVRDDALRSISSPPSNQVELKQWFDEQPSESNPKLFDHEDPESLERSLRYHVIEGRYLVDDLADGILLPTELEFRGQSRSKQRMPVSVSESDGKGVSNSKGKRSPLVGFGGVNVVGGDPIQVGNTVIYVLSQVIPPPSDLLRVALSDIRFSTGVASIFSAKLDEQFKSVPELTYLMPTNRAFEDLGLIMDYLLLERSKGDLSQVLKYHGIVEVVYQNEIKLGTSQRYPTLEGAELYITKLASRNITLHGPTVGGVPLNGETRDSEVINKRDVLIENGSMQFVNQVELPPGLNIGLRKLMLGAKASTMLELIQSSNLSWILMNPESPSSNSSSSSSSGGIDLTRGFTILCPSDEAFTKVNLTYYLEDKQRLDALVRQHIIPTYPSSSDGGDGRPTTNPARGDDGLPGPQPAPFQPLYIQDGMVYPTMLSRREGGGSDYGDVSFRLSPSITRTTNGAIGRFDGRPDGDGKGGDGEEGDDHPKNRFRGKWLVGIRGARGTDGEHDSGRVMNYGRASPRVIPSSSIPIGGGGRHVTTATVDLVSFAGGILSLDKVLEPYAPHSFWDRFLPGGPLLRQVLIWCFFLCLLGLIGYVGWKFWTLYRNRSSRLMPPPVVVSGYHIIEPMEE